MTELSPAAQAVLDAYCTHADFLNREVSHEEMLAAAIIAAVDQVVPAQMNRGLPEIRAELLAIAAELKGSNG